MAHSVVARPHTSEALGGHGRREPDVEAANATIQALRDAGWCDWRGTASARGVELELSADGE